MKACSAEEKMWFALIFRIWQFHTRPRPMGTLLPYAQPRGQPTTPRKGLPTIVLPTRWVIDSNQANTKRMKYSPVIRVTSLGAL